MIPRTGADPFTHIKTPEFIYPADTEGKELDDGARVWRHFNDETERYDFDMVERWKTTINVLLVFAGLFSAVVTAFAVDSARTLDPDYPKITASLLLEIANFNRNTSSVPLISLDNSLFESHPQPRLDTLMHGLWYTSLTLSLLVSVTCVLVGQWLSSYLSPFSASHENVAKTRQFRFQGLKRWGVSVIIGLLPFLLIMALFLFLGGLVIFLRTFHHSISILVGALSAASFFLYLVSIGLPAFFLDCPYRTSLSSAIFWLLSALTRLILNKDKQFKTLDIAQQEQEVVAQKLLGASCLFWVFDYTQSAVIDMVVIEALAALCPNLDDGLEGRFIKFNNQLEERYREAMFLPLRHGRLFASSLMNSIETWWWNLPEDESSELMTSLNQGIIIRVSKTVVYLCHLECPEQVKRPPSREALDEWEKRKRRFVEFAAAKIIPTFRLWNARKQSSAASDSANEADKCFKLDKRLGPVESFLRHRVEINNGASDAAPHTTRHPTPSSSERRGNFISLSSCFCFTCPCVREGRTSNATVEDFDHHNQRTAELQDLQDIESDNWIGETRRHNYTLTQLRNHDSEGNVLHPGAGNCVRAHPNGFGPNKRSYDVPNDEENGLPP